MRGAFSIGDWHVEPSSRTLTGANGDVHLEPKVMQVLMLLAQHQGEVVTKEAVLQHVWPDVFVGDEVLSRTISELRRALGDDRKSPRYIQTIPKGGYRLIASVKSPGPAVAAAASSPASGREPQPIRRWRSRVLWATGIAAVITIALVGVAIGAWPLRRPPAVNVSPRVVPLTTLNGWEGYPTFSPDGTQVAFTWSGPNADSQAHDKLDTYVQVVGGSGVRRLLSDPGMNFDASWSPDGKHIAFVRCGSGGCRIYLTSALGGPQRKLSDLTIEPPIGWSPDSQYVVTGHWWGRPGEPPGEDEGNLYLIPLNGGEPRPITRKPAGVEHSAPAFSPDGRQLAYVSHGYGGRDVYVVDVDASFTPSSAPRRLTTETVMNVQSVVWVRDGKSVIYDAEAVPFVMWLWRVDVDGRHPPERIELAGQQASLPATVASQDRLAFQRSYYNADIYRSAAGRPAQAVVTSSFPDFEPQFSPDGRRIVFTSSAVSGDTQDIWVAASDGSGAHALTIGPNRMQASPQWSPDGRWIAFDSLGADGHWHVWTVDENGNTRHQITPGAGDEMTPTWSHDGHWLYFWSDKHIWRIPPAGGRRERVAERGAMPFACESADGKSLLFQPSDPSGNRSLWSMPLAGGPARELVACVTSGAFAAGARGIYYVGCNEGADPPVHLLDPVTGHTRLLGTLDKYEYRMSRNLAVSPDGNTILYSKMVTTGDDLMLIENFH
jgi:Tol biopolymer transport system component/DNA-binding winged helix-turn-helix (wHTH) protein